MKILIIESDEALRLGCLEIFNIKGIEADAAATVEEAYSLLESGAAYSVIIYTNADLCINNYHAVFLEKPYTAHKLLQTARKGGSTLNGYS